MQKLATQETFNFCVICLEGSIDRLNQFEPVSTGHILFLQTFWFNPVRAQAANKVFGILERQVD